MDGNFIKVYRSILDMDIWQRKNDFRLFIYMLIKANWKDGNFDGQVVKRGSFVSSYQKISTDTDLTINQVRTSVKHLMDIGEITHKSHAKYSVFTINNYDLYQENHTQITTKPQTNNTNITHKSQQDNTEITTIEEEKENNNKYIYTCARACERFEDFWNAYPKKVMRSLAEQAYAQAVVSGMDEDSLVEAAKNYAEASQVQHWLPNYICNPDNWFQKSRYVEYLPENYQKPVQRKEGKPKSKNKFINYPQRAYDYQSLEKQLLGEMNVGNGVEREGLS